MNIEDNETASNAWLRPANIIPHVTIGTTFKFGSELKIPPRIRPIALAAPTTVSIKLANVSSIPFFKHDSVRYR